MNDGVICEIVCMFGFDSILMLTFDTTLLQFEEQGEKTGWTYIEFSAAQADALYPKRRQSFRVRGLLDAHPIRSVALLPMGDGRFVMAFNAGMRKATGKGAGDSISVALEHDPDEQPLSEDFLACLETEPAALAFFETLPKGHQRYFSNWIESAKTLDTKTNRIAKAIRGLAMQMGYNEMVRYFKDPRNKLLL